MSDSKVFGKWALLLCSLLLCLEEREREREMVGNV